MTGICAAVGAQLLGRHGRSRTGFVDPEAYFDPDEFLAELAARGTIEVSWRDERL
jgi:saccharopine dehydrogenase-like NADP-dependent oxidoreductase